MRLILCSTSSARKTLLERLQLPIEVIAPDVDETPKPKESPIHLVKRLAETKARVHAHKFPNSLLIGCDQVAVIGKNIVSKPETHDNAVMQLIKSSGKRIRFYTAICLLNTKTNHTQIAVEKFDVVYRKLSSELIEKYLQREKPYHCAGSIKAEGLGIALFKRVVGNDPTTLTGLPLIRLTEMLESEGVAVI